MTLPLSQIDYENSTVNFNIGPGTAAPISNPGLISSLTTDEQDYSVRALENPTASTNPAVYKLDDGNFPAGNFLQVPWSLYVANVGGQQPGGTNTFIIRTVGGAGQGIGFSLNRQQDRFDTFVNNSGVGDFTMVEGNSNNVANPQPLNQDNVQALFTFEPNIGTNGLGQFNLFTSNEGVPSIVTKVLTYNVATVTVQRPAVEMDTGFNGSGSDKNGNKIEDLRIYPFVAAPKIVTSVTDYHDEQAPVVSGFSGLWHNKSLWGA